MVHLATVQKDPEVAPASYPAIDHEEDPDHLTSVYGSRFATEDLPSINMPEASMPRDVAYRMIKDHLSLDGNPMLK